MIQVYEVTSKANLEAQTILECEYQSEVSRYSSRTTKLLLAVEYYSGYLIVDVWKAGVCILSFRDLDADNVHKIVTTAIA